jgi:UDP-glucose 4-epimerase
LVLGGGGFIGQWVVRVLRARGAGVTVVSRSRSPKHDRNWLTCDLRELDIAATVAARGIDAVFHFAGSADAPGSFASPLRDLEGNVAQTLHTLEALVRVPQPPIYVYGSSAAVYGRVSRLPIREQDAVTPLSPYAVSKLAAESYVSFYHRAHGLPSVSLRLFSAYGPGQRKQAVYDLLRRAQEPGAELVIKAPAGASRDFVYVEDVANAIVDLAVRAPGCGEVLNVASGRETTMHELATTILNLTHPEKRLVFDSAGRPGDPFRYVGATELASALGVRLDTKIEQGLLATLAWMTECAYVAHGVAHQTTSRRGIPSRRLWDASQLV